MPFSPDHYLHRYLCWQHRFYYIDSSYVANIHVDYIDIYVQMKRALVYKGLLTFHLKVTSGYCLLNIRHDDKFSQTYVVISRQLFDAF